VVQDPLGGTGDAAAAHELGDFERAIIERLLPNKPMGVPRAYDRKMLNGIY
jgi:transposase